MAPRRKCPVCGSKQWHKEPSSGLVTCSEGHVLQVNPRIKHLTTTHDHITRNWHGRITGVRREKSTSSVLMQSENDILSPARRSKRNGAGLILNVCRSLASHTSTYPDLTNFVPVYHGKQARYHYMECLQLMLRMQVVSLMRIWQLPPDFEVVVASTILCL